MPYDIDRLQRDVAQIQHDDAGFGSGRLVAQNLVLTAAHTLLNEKDGTGPVLDGWQVRLARDRSPDAWRFRRGNFVIWCDLRLDLGLIKLVNQEGDPVRPEFRLRVATVSRNNAHSVEARGYPRASKQADGPRELTPARGRLTAAQQDRPLRFGVDTCDLPNRPHADWPGMSGSAVLLQEGRDPDDIWVYGVIQAVPENFNGQLTVARLADAWHKLEFRRLLVAAGAPDKDTEDPSLDEIGNANASIRLLPDLIRDMPAVVEAISRSKEAIENTYRQVDKLELLKMIHDELHTIEFEVLRPMEKEAAGSRVPFAVGFAGNRRNIEGSIKGREMPVPLREELVERLESTGKAFRAAAAAPSENSYNYVCGELNGLLSSIAPELDQEIGNTAAELRLDHLVKLMGMVRDKLPSPTSVQDQWRRYKIQDFNLGVDELAGLHDKLTQHVREHQRLQRLDSKLRAICVGKVAPGSLVSEWERVKRVRSQLTPPFSPAMDEANIDLKEMESSIEADFLRGDAQNVLKLLDAYFRSVSFVFRNVDRNFKEFTLELSRLRPSLKAVLDSF